MEDVADRGYFCDMNNPRYKKIAKSEVEGKSIRRERLSGEVQDVFGSYFRMYCIVVGIFFIVKGMAGIIWRTLH